MKNEIHADIQTHQLEQAHCSVGKNLLFPDRESNPWLNPNH